MTWWTKAWWIWIDDGFNMRSARGRRRVWRAEPEERPNRLATVTWLEDIRCPAEEAKWEKWKRRQTDRQCTESTLHLVLHLPQNANATATEGHLQQQQQQHSSGSKAKNTIVKERNLVQSGRQRDCAPPFAHWDWRSVAQ